MKTQHAFAALLLTSVHFACNPKMIEPRRDRPALTVAESAYLKELADASVAEVPVLFVTKNDIQRKIVAVNDVLPAAESFAAQSADRFVALDLPVRVEHIESVPGGGANNLDGNFSGKEEFGLADWKRNHPEADGRNVTIAVVDDGVSLKRPGLLRTSDGKNKIKNFINTNARWHIEIDPSAETQVYLGNCGFRKPNLPPAKTCHDLGSNFPDRITERLVTVSPSGEIQVEGLPSMRALSVDSNSMISLADGSAWGFDLVQQSGKTFLHVKVPEHASVPSGRTIIATGSHGEGVAGVAAGFEIAGRRLNGVAPGAQVLDVHFTDSTGYQEYTIGSVAQALLQAGEHADVVNLSYSLFFSSPAAQSAMGKLMENTLKNTNAIYLFSAGNNGPGINSMNRSLIYPSFSLPVAAYLNGRLSQTTFGSVTPLGIVAPYSSVGPGIDGGLASLVLSPLAGIVPSTTNDGFRPFSGTSSATPAMAGFVARLISQIRAEGLTLNRDILRESILRSANPIQGSIAIEQGFGIPVLESALSHYKTIQQNRNAYKLFIVGGTNSQGVKAKGIYLRDLSQLESVYSFSLGVEPFQKLSSEELGSLSGVVQVTSNKNWVRFPDRLFLSKGGTSLQVSIDRTQIIPGILNTAELTLTSDTGAKAILPITVIDPATDLEIMNSIQVPAGSVFRFFWKADASVKNVWIRRATRASALCGRFGIYNPSGIREGDVVQARRLIPSMEEKLMKVSGEGVYEIDIEGRLNHQSCADDSQQTFKLLAMPELNIHSEGIMGEDLDWSLSLSSQSSVFGQWDSRLVTAELKDPYQVTSDFLVPSKTKNGVYEMPFAGSSAGESIIFDVKSSPTHTSLIHYAAADLIYVTADEVRGANSGLMGQVPAGMLEYYPFEMGLSNFPKPSSIPVDIYKRQVEDANANVSLGSLDLTKPVSGRARMTGLPTQRYYRCEFRPNAFALNAECGNILY